PGPHGGAGRAGGEELEQAITTEQREAALEAALQDDRFGTAGRLVGRAAPGWAGERVMAATKNDWEPAVAADPHRPFVYIVATRYGDGKPCPGSCPSPYMALEISNNGGHTFGSPKPLCACKGSGQYDPIIEVVQSTGWVYAVYMNGFNVMFIRSADHGKTWSEPVPTYGNVTWTDKPVMTTSADGKHVYVAWNGPTNGDPWIAQSHDFGQTWTQKRIRHLDRYFYAYDATVAPDGTVVISQSSMVYKGGTTIEGPVRQHAFVSRDKGRSWTVVTVATVQPGQPCADCRADYYVGHSSVDAAANGRLVFTYDGAVAPLGPQRVYVTSSTNRGTTWTAPIELSDPAEHASSPMLVARGSGDVRLVYMQTADGAAADRWNAWYVRSTNGGATWSAPVDI
ncbi:MAG: sialidase family protein, partial [Ilumatobacteraceae bacterium]